MKVEREKMADRNSDRMRRWVCSELCRICMILLFLISGAACCIYGQEDTDTGRIQGRVMDKGRYKPLSGVLVEMEASSMGCVTDLDGCFRIDHVPEGNYRIRMSLKGYQRMLIDDLSVIRGQITFRTVEMKSRTAENEEKTARRPAVKILGQ